MLRFTLFGFPVSIHWSFWVTALLIGMQSAVGKSTPAVYLAIWCAAVAFSVLAHELGHAVFMRRFGGRPQIALYWMGGLASSQGRLHRRQSIIVSLMGPAAGLLIGGIVWAASHFMFQGSRAPGAFTGYAIMALVWINIGWSLVNLLPVLPLDGGHVLQAAFGPRNQRLVYQISFAVAAAVAVLLFFNRGFMWMVFGFFAYSNFQRMRGSNSQLF